MVGVNFEMRRIPPISFVLFVTVFLSLPALADGGRVVAGIDVGGYVPRLSHPDVEDFDIAPGPAYGGRLGYGFTNRATFELGFLRSQTRAKVGGGQDIDVAFNEVATEATWSILTGPIRPQLLGAVCYQMIQADDPVADDGGFGLRFGLGFSGVLTSYLHAGLAVRYHLLFPEEFETDNVLSVLAKLDFLY